MRTFTAHVRPAAPPVLVEEAFAWGALLFGPLWLLRQRAWIAALATAAALALVLAGPPSLRPALGFGVLLLLGFTGRDLVRADLARRGYALAHVVAARDADEALFRLLGQQPGAAVA